MHQSKTYHIDRFWNDEFKQLEYHQEAFNDPTRVQKWLELGFSERICGYMCDMRRPQPAWNHKFIDFFHKQGWQDVGTSYYKMLPGTILPMHEDTYKNYIQRFRLQDIAHNIHRAIVFLEDWSQGHYFDCMGQAFVHWKAGDVVEWLYNTPHSAANLGFQDRYTLQITGHRTK